MDAAAEGEVLPRVGAVEAEIGGALEAPGVAVGRAVQQHHRRTGRDLDAADRRRPAGQAEVGLHRALDAQRLLDELRDAVVVRAELVLELGILREVLERRGEQARRRLLAGGEQERRGAHDRDHVGRRSVGVLRERQVGEDVAPRLAAAFLDVRGEVVVEPPEGVHRHPALIVTELARIGAEAEAGTEPLVLRFGNAEEVGDHEHRERLGVRADELAGAPGDQLVELTIGEAPHELLVLLQSLRRDQAHEQRPLARVLRRVHGDHVLVHRELIPVALDDRRRCRRPRAEPGSSRRGRSPSCTTRTCRGRGTRRSPRPIPRPRSPRDEGAA